MWSSIELHGPPIIGNTKDVVAFSDFFFVVGGIPIIRKTPIVVYSQVIISKTRDFVVFIYIIIINSLYAEVRNSVTVDYI